MTSSSRSTCWHLVQTTLLFTLLNATALEAPRTNAFLNTAGRSIRPIFSRALNVPNKNGSYEGGLLLGRTDNVPTPPMDAFHTMTADGGDLLIPKGVYYKRNSKSSIQGSVDTPNFRSPSELLGRFGAVNGAVRQADNRLTGLYVPMPFGLQPVSFQMIDEGATVQSEGLNLGVKQLRTPADHESNDNLLSVLRTVQRSILTDGDALNRLRKSVTSNDFLTRLFGQMMPTVVRSVRRMERTTTEAPPMNARDILLSVGQLLKRQHEAKRFVNSLRDGSGLASRLANNLLVQLTRQLSRTTDSSAVHPKPSVVNSELSNNDERSVGIVMSAPGVDPIYVGGFLDSIRDGRRPTRVPRS